MNSRIFYRGPSQLDGRPIIGVLTGLTTRGRNPKTGDMLQTYILREDVPPPMALQTGADASICGDCKLRGIGGAARGCYVQTKWAPLGVWKVARAVLDAPPVRDMDIAHERLEALVDGLRGRHVRLGTYGDPAALPYEHWQWLLEHAGGWTGYTHQWRTAPLPFMRLCMASVDSPEEQREAAALGWRTFRVRRADEPVVRTEIVCPASHEWEAAGRTKITCQQCRLCRGLARPAKNIVIVAHGQGAKYAGAPLLPFAQAATP